MKIRLTFPLTEQEGGCPEVSAYDVGLRHMRAFPNNQVLPFISSGSHPASTMFDGIYGPAADGLGSVQPSVIPDYYYFGGYPTQKQPQIKKPAPWE